MPDERAEEVHRGAAAEFFVEGLVAVAASPAPAGLAAFWAVMPWRR